MKNKFQFPNDEDNENYLLGFLYGLTSAGHKVEIIRDDTTLETFPKISVVFRDRLLPSGVWTALNELGFREIK